MVRIGSTLELIVEEGSRASTHRGSATMSVRGLLVARDYFPSRGGTQGDHGLRRSRVRDRSDASVSHRRRRTPGVRAAPAVIRVKVQGVLHELEGAGEPTEPARVKAETGARNGTGGFAADPEDGVLILGATDAHAGVIPYVGTGDRVVVSSPGGSVGHLEVAASSIVAHLGSQCLGADHNGVGSAIGNTGNGAVEPGHGVDV